MTDSQKLDLLLEKVTSMGSDIVELKRDVRELKEDMADVKLRICKLEEDMADIKPRICKLEEDMADIKPRICKLEEDMADIKPRVCKLEKDVKVIQLDVENELRISIKRVAEAHLDLSRALTEARKPNEELEVLGVKVRNNESEIRKINNMLNQYVTA